LNFFTWFILGLPFLFLIVYNDIYFVIKTAFIPRKNSSDKNLRIKQSLKSADIVLFLKFIHQRAKEDRNDLHSIFTDYLRFEKEKLDESIEQSKGKDRITSELIACENKDGRGRRESKLSSIMKRNIKKTITDCSSSHNLINKYKNKKSDRENQRILSSSFLKKNIIIIETLENFLIDDESEDCLVDIEKMQQLLPKTRIIDKYYLNRLIFTNLSYINKALTLLNKKEDKLIYQELTNKLVYAVNSIDERIDRYVKITKKQEVKNNTLNYIVTSGSDDEKGNNQYFNNEISEILENISNDIYEQIKAYEKKCDIISEEEHD